MVSSKSERGMSSLLTAMQPRHTDRGALLPQQGGRAVDAVGTGDDEDGGVGGAQPRAQLTDEVGVSGGVDEVDRQAGTLDRGDLDAHRALVLALVRAAARHVRAATR
jgi:hypothetical protein